MHERDLLHAYYTAQFAWAKDRHRALTQALKASRGEGRQTPQEQHLVMQKIAAFCGVELTFRPKAAAHA